MLVNAMNSPIPHTPSRHSNPEEVSFLAPRHLPAGIPKPVRKHANADSRRSIRHCPKEVGARTENPGHPA
jgi:hypothetical protein